MSANTAQEAPEVMLGTFSVNSISATILFDLGDLHSFISQAFVRMHSIPLCAIKNPILVNSPGGSMPTSYWSPSASLSLSGVDFKVKPIVLRTAGIDLILGMDWMKQHRAVIQCQEKSVVVTSLNGDRICVEVVVQAQPIGIVNQLDGEVNEQDRVVEEFPDVFPMTC